MSTRPRVAADLIASITSLAPARLVKKLDAAPRAAEGWEWSFQDASLKVVTDTKETVTIEVGSEVVLRDAQKVRCSCLLSPKCFHILATVSVLEIEDIAAGESSGETEKVEAALAPEEKLALTPGQKEAARLAFGAASEFLSLGATGIGAVLQGEMLRVVHMARTEGLYRLASAGLRVVRDIRDLKADAPSFSLEELCDDLEELTVTAYGLGGNDSGQGLVDTKWIGIGRRAYETVGNLRLTGLLCEPVITQSGYAGIVSYLCDADARVWTVADLQPGSPERSRSAYQSSISMGDASLAHKSLCREGLFVQNATGSKDMRLGSGAQVKAVRAKGSSWDDEGVQKLFRVPVARQLDRCYEALRIPQEDRPRAQTLMFLEGVVVGSDGAALLIASEDGTSIFRLVAPSDHAFLVYRSNLRLLSEHPGLPLRAIGHVLHEEPKSVAVLAIGVGKSREEGPCLVLGEDLGGRVNLAYDSLQRSNFRLAGTLASGFKGALVSGSSPENPLLAMVRRSKRLAMYGVRSFPTEAMTLLERECFLLGKRMMPSGAGLLQRFGLDVISASKDHKLRGSLALSWMWMRQYEHACTRYVHQARWT